MRVGIIELLVDKRLDGPLDGLYGLFDSLPQQQLAGRLLHHRGAVAGAAKKPSRRSDAVIMSAAGRLRG